jgi:meiotic recombination protein SPO11
MMTRAFLHWLGRQRPDIPIFVLTDFDPDGVSIFRCYLHGSGNILTDSTVNNPSIRWLGIKSSHLAAMSSMSQPSAAASFAAPSGAPTTIQSHTPNLVTALTLRDRKMIVDCLERLATGDVESLDFVRRELQVMQMLGCKAEIQLLDKFENLNDWLDVQMEIEMNNL